MLYVKISTIIVKWGMFFHHQVLHSCQSKGESQGCEQSMTLKSSEKPA